MHFDQRRLVVFLLLLLPVASARPDADGWVLEFGPYSGYYDFDRVSQFQDHPLFGVRMGVRAAEQWRIETEFEEVYTQREPTQSAARQITLALHGRFEPFRHRLSTGVFAGIAYVGLDDSDATDSYGEGYDVGLGIRYAATLNWILRADWMLRRQSVLLHRADGSQQNLDLFSRAFRIGAVYAF